MSHPLLLWNDAYFFGGLAQVFLFATLVVGGMALLLYVLSTPKREPNREPNSPPVANKGGGCRSAMLVVMLVVVALLFALFLLAKWAATPYYLR